MQHAVYLKIAAIIGLAAAGSMAIAEPGSGVSGEGLVSANLNEPARANHDNIRLHTKGMTDVRLQKLTFAPGSRSGWHHHPGVLIVSVKEGLVTLTDQACRSKTYGPGSPNGSVFVEAHDHPQQATSAGGAIAYVTIIVPRGAPSRLEDSPPGCANPMSARSAP